MDKGGGEDSAAGFRILFWMTGCKAAEARQIGLLREFQTYYALQDGALSIHA